QLLSFQLPTDYKRVPLVGILQVLLGRIVGGTHPDLTGGWLLNSIVHSLTIVMLWLAGRKIIGRAAIWFAIIAIINPFGLQLLTEAIAETPMLFFIWLSFYLIFIRSKWAYLAASLATMVRYECAALIAGAFVLDMIEGQNKKERWLAFGLSVLASIPLVIWLIGTVIHSHNLGATHYLNIFKKDYTSHFVEGVQNRTGIVRHLNILWQVGFYPLLTPSPQAGKSLADAIFTINKVIVVASFLFGSIYGLYKKQWKILVLLIFLLPYFWVHSKYPYPIHRYHATIFAVVMLICIYGLCAFWNLFKDKLPAPAVVFAQTLLILTALIWFLILAGHLPKLAPMSRASVSLPYVAILVVFAAFIAERFIYKVKPRDFVVLAAMILMIVSNQFLVAAVVGNGERDIEFKYLVEWYRSNAKPDEKLVTTVPIILQIMAPDFKDNFIHTNTFDANNPTDFAKECYERNITYVAWDSREGLIPHDYYYKSWKMANIAPLIAGRDIGPYQFITQIRVNQRRYINLYRLRYPPPEN
ncbi:MAG: hypothetical protein PHQ00_02680, partial [Phycisphaerae bacterium]|nr:hypothetical protein [Phycisphaerae bacterium]